MPKLFTIPQPSQPGNCDNSETIIPWSEPVLAPSDLFDSELLVTVEP